MKERKILIFGNYGGQNWGDEVILSGILSAFPKGILTITVVSSSPKRTKELHSHIFTVLPPPFGIPSFFRPQSFAVIAAIRKSDMIFFGGGGLFQDREKKAIFLWGWYHFIARFFGKRVIFIANSVGPLNSWISKYIVKKSFSGSRFISLRDDASKTLLEDLGVQENRIISATDAAFLLRKPASVLRRKGTLLLFRGDGEITRAQIKKMLPLLPKPVSVLPMDTVDVPFAKALGIPMIEPNSLLDLRKYIASTRLLLSSRLHGGILALQSETPFLMFSAAPKVKYFFSERHLKELVLPENYSDKKLKKMITSLVKNSSKWKKIFRKIRLSEQQKAKNILPEFFQR